MLAQSASHGHDFLLAVKNKAHYTPESEKTVHFPQAGSAAVSIVQNKIKN